GLGAAERDVYAAEQRNVYHRGVQPGSRAVLLRGRRAAGARGGAVEPEYAGKRKPAVLGPRLEDGKPGFVRRGRESVYRRGCILAADPRRRVYEEQRVSRGTHSPDGKDVCSVGLGEGERR